MSIKFKITYEYGYTIFHISKTKRYRWIYMHVSYRQVTVSPSCCFERYQDSFITSLVYILHNAMYDGDRLLHRFTHPTPVMAIVDFQKICVLNRMLAYAYTVGQESVQSTTFYTDDILRPVYGWDLFYLYKFSFIFSSNAKTRKTTEL